MRSKRKKIILDLFTLSFIIWLIVVVVGMGKYPEKVSQFLGFRFYVVLTDSMEPKIPTYSLVFTKMIDEDAPIDPNTIVTFHANRFGEDVLLTHYFKEVQEKDGEAYYRTQGATAPEYDNYETSRSDIIGEYGFHIPYIGKFILFMQSQFAWIMYAEWGVLWLVNKTIKTYWKEKESKEKLTTQLH